MKEQILIARGKLAELKKKHRQLELKAENLRIQLGIIFNPYEINSTAIETEKGLAAATELHAVVTELKKINDEREKISDALGL